MRSGSFSVVLPYYNELRFIRAPLECLLAQERLPEQLILIDNASSDGSEELCRSILKQAPAALDVVYLREERPGQLHALIAGVQRAEGEYVSIWNADMLYPPHYFSTCERIIRASQGRAVCVMAKDILRPPDALTSRCMRFGYHYLAKLRPRMCFTGGAGQTFKASALRECGGYSLERWPYVLEDHEIAHRVLKLGATHTHPDLWCLGSPRRRNRRATGWTLPERLLYFCTPHSRGDWFFYQFLGPRLARRKQDFLKLRERDWEQPPPASSRPHAASRSTADTAGRAA